MKDYANFTDEELINRYRAGERDICEYICSKYKGLVRKKADSLFILGSEEQDLIQEGMIGLFSAIRDFDDTRDTSFLTFAGLCVSRQMYKAIARANRQNTIPLNNYISIDEESGYNMLEEFAADMTGGNPESVILDREAVESLLNSIKQELSGLELQVLRLHLSGLGYVEIAGILGREEKSTDNALQRAKAKVRGIVEAAGRDGRQDR